MSLQLSRLAPAVLACTTLLAASARADVKLPPIFGDHMVLQQGIDAPVWGTADAGEEVKVSVGDQTGTARADAGARGWCGSSP